MCLVLFAWRSHPRFPLILAANRDEFHMRPTAAAQWWQEYPDLLAGRDLQAGGTWLGVNRRGNAAALTNYREPELAGATQATSLRSRGVLVRDYLAGDLTAMQYAGQVANDGAHYSGFNLLLSDGEDLVCVSNRADAVTVIQPGVHGLSNHLLNTDWPKVHAGKQKLQSLVASPADTSLAEGNRLADLLFDLLTEDAAMPGRFPAGFEAGLTSEHLARHMFIASPIYGTRCSTVVLHGSDGSVYFEERRFDASTSETGRDQFSIEGRI